jgi:hypothetical protein
MSWKKIKLKDEEVISEILASDSDCDSGTEATILKSLLMRRKKKKTNNNNNSKLLHKSKRAATYGGLPTWGPPNGTQIYIILSDQ